MVTVVAAVNLDVKIFYLALMLHGCVTHSRSASKGYWGNTVVDTLQSEFMSNPSEQIPSHMK